VFGTGRSVVQPPLRLPAGYVLDQPNRADGRDLLRAVDAEGFPLVVFDPQYRGVLDRQAYGNEGARQQQRATLPQMDEAVIREFLALIDRALMPGGHLFLWVDKFHLCTGITAWLAGTALATVDLVTWDKQRIGMGYRTRRSSEHCLVLQKAPLRAKGVWTAHDIPDVWPEKVLGGFTHAKPVGLQAALVAAVTSPGDTVLDPAAGSFSVLDACRRTGRRFLGCDVRG
jgi:site-specific DNA-methyltransferase (adenine-specific)